MFKHSSLCLPTLLLCIAPLHTAHAAPAAAAAYTDAALGEHIDAMVGPYYKTGGPGATLLVIKDGKVLLRKVYGLADVRKGVPLQPGSLMRIGSVTKQFTSAAILLLADEGKLTVTDPITKFFPDYPTRGEVITIEHLLTHTSGIANYTAKGSLSNRNKTVAQMIDSFKNEPLDFAPGTRFAYNNSGYYLLGALIEKVSGQTYAAFLEQRILQPLGMIQTGYEGVGAGAAVRATGHTPNMWGRFGPVSDISMSQVYAAGAMVSTIDDLALWDAAVSSGKVLKSASWTQAATPFKLTAGTSTNYGYGWQTAKVRGADEIGHGGDINGFAAYTLRLPQHKVYVALLTNADSGSGLVRPAVVAKKAAAIAIGNPYPDYRAVALEPGRLKVYTGAYRLDEKTTRIVRSEGDHLQILRAGRPTLALHPLGGDRFFVKDALTVYRFDRNADGTIARLILDDDGVEQVHMREEAGG